MTIGLATRGYLVPRRIFILGDGPEIVATSMPAPTVKTSTLEEKPAPTILSGNRVVPVLQGAVEESTPPPAQPPSGTGTALIPIIRSAKKE